MISFLTPIKANNYLIGLLLDLLLAVFLLYLSTQPNKIIQSLVIWEYFLQNTRK